MTTNPLLLPINTRRCLQEIGGVHRGTATLDSIPEAVFEGWIVQGVTHLWLMGVWTTGPPEPHAGIRSPGPAARVRSRFVRMEQGRRSGFSPRDRTVQGFRALGGQNGLLELTRRGIQTVHLRSSYRTNESSEQGTEPYDPRGYRSMVSLRSPDGEPVISPGYDYITLWGYWKRREKRTVDKAEGGIRATNAVHAWRRGLFSREQLAQVDRVITRRLSQQGFEHLNLRPDHLLLAFDRDRNLILDEDGDPDTRLCNLELLRGPKSHF